MDAERAATFNETRAEAISAELGVGYAVEEVGHFDPVTFDPTLVARVRSSLFGRSLIAIRGGEDLARSAGINVYTHKLRVMMLSTALAGFAGGLYAVYIGFLGAAITGPTTTFTILLYLLVGGVGTLAGPLLGTLIIRVLQQSIQGLQDYQYIVFGPLLVLLVLFFPAGLAGLWEHLRGRRTAFESGRKAGKGVQDAGV